MSDKQKPLNLNVLLDELEKLTASAILPGKLDELRYIGQNYVPKLVKIARMYIAELERCGRKKKLAEISAILPQKIPPS